LRSFYVNNFYSLTYKSRFFFLLVCCVYGLYICMRALGVVVLFCGSSLTVGANIAGTTNNAIYDAYILLISA